MSFFKFLLKRITATIPLLIGLRLPRTLFLALITLVLGQLMGVLLGIFAAVHQYRWGDIVATVIAFIGIVIPKFVVARVMLYFLVFVWHYPYVGALYSSEYVIQDHFS